MEYTGGYPSWFYHTWFFHRKMDKHELYELKFINEARWVPTIPIKKIFSIAFLIWGIIVTSEVAYNRTFDGWTIMTLTIFWVAIVSYVAVVFSIKIHTRRTLVLYYGVLTIVSIITPFLVVVKSLKCLDASTPIDFINPEYCADENRPRLRTFYLFVVVGPLISLLVLENSVVFQAIGMLTLFIPYRIHGAISNTNRSIFGSIIDDILVLGTYVIILYVAVFWHSLIRSMYQLSKNLERQMTLRQQFVSYIFHEIRNPLNIITLAVSSPVHGNYDMLVKTIVPSISMMENILNDTLDFQSITQGSFRLNIVSFNFHEMVNQAITSMKPLLDAKQQHFSLVMDLNKLTRNVFGDQLRIRQIILNYLSNAVKYTEHEGSIKLIIGIKRIIKNTVTISISVTDTGIGISEENQSRLFQPFIQIKNRFSEEIKGTGLGLSIVAELVNLMGGTFGVKSQLGRGSNFYCTLPLRIDSSTNRTIDPILSPLEEPDIENISDLSVLSPILIADDDAITCSILKQILLGWNIESDYVHNGKEAFDIINTETPITSPDQIVAYKKYKVLLIDDLMPVMTGQTAIRLLRERGHKIPIVGITGNAEESDKILRYGADHIIIKPVKRLTLMKTFRKILQSIQTNSPGSFQSSDIS